MGTRLVRLAIATAAAAAVATDARAQYVRVSVSSAGTQANGASATPSLSASGRFVAFASDATNLVEGDTNGTTDIFVRDRDTDGDGVLDEPNAVSTRRVSVLPDGTQANGPSTAPVVDAIGTEVVFLSRATNLVPGLVNPVRRVFRVALQTGAIELVSVSGAGTPADDDCDGIAYGTNPGGPHIAFRSFARTLAPGHPGVGGAIYVRSPFMGTTVRVSPPIFPDSGVQGRNVSMPTMSDDAGFIGFAIARIPEPGELYVTDRYGNQVRSLGRGVDLKFDAFSTSFVAVSEATFLGASTFSQVSGSQRPVPGPGVPAGSPAPLPSRLGRYALYPRPSSAELFDFLSGESTRLPFGARAAAWSRDDRIWGIETDDTLVAGDTNGVADIVAVDLERLFDADQDGLDDRWERLSNLDPASAAGANGAAGDPDGDGQTNLQEFQTTMVQPVPTVPTHPTGLLTRYLAEGSAGSFFDTRLAIVNPDPALAAAVQIRYRSSYGFTVVQPMLVGPRARRTSFPTAILGLDFTDFSIEVESDRPVVVDRRMTWDASGYGAHLETAPAAPATTWYVAEGSTVLDFNLFYLLQNPQAAPVQATVRFLRPAGAPIVRVYDLAPTSRTTIYVNVVDAALAETDVSADVTATAPIVVERSMYANRPGQDFALGHAAAGSTATASRWFLAEGATGSFFDLYVLVANPGASDAAIEARFLKPDGSVVTRSYTVAAASRFSIYVDAIAGLEDTPVATEIVSTNGVPVIVERSMYWPGGFFDYYEGHSSAGTTATSLRWALAEGQNDSSAQSYVLIANTAATPGEARVTLLLEGAGTPETQVVALPPSSRTTIPVGTSTVQPFGVLVESIGASPVPIVVEGAYYWTVNGQIWAAGGNLVATPLP
jgi:hypothetical protein